MVGALKQKISWHLVLFFLAVAIFVIYWATSGGTTPYNYFIRLADSFLQGKYYLDTNPSWLNELVPIMAGKFAVVYPPAPAIISIPFVLIFGKNIDQTIVSQIMGTIAIFVWGEIAYLKSGRKIVSLWIFLLAGLGNIVWFMAGNGSVWYMGQVSAFMFLSLAIYESLNKKRIIFLVLYFALAVFSRLQVVLALPLVIYLNWSKFKDIKKLSSFILGVSFFGIIYGIYNYLRFGSFLETGYSLIPGVLAEPWYGGALFKYSHIISNLKVMFMSIPRFSNHFPYVTPSWGGLSIWITSPAFVYLFWAKRNTQNLITWVSIFLIAFVIFIHGGTGFTQFGYRYAVDFYPLILFLIVDSVGNKDIKWHHWTLLLISVLVNIWGVIFINKFGYVGW
ncbi:MAG TPA: hypothetical protein VKC53_00870 [Patescibacteria group bacterium]|nr:hypothetical protein [Patescibacteria group bacterium]